MVIVSMIMLLESGDHVAFSSGHNIELYRDRMAFIPIIDADTSYTISARWLTSLDEKKVEAVSGGFEYVRRKMTRWSDGYCGAS